MALSSAIFPERNFFLVLFFGERQGIDCHYHRLALSEPQTWIFAIKLCTRDVCHFSSSGRKTLSSNNIVWQNVARYNHQKILVKGERVYLYSAAEHFALSCVCRRNVTDSLKSSAVENGSSSSSSSKKKVQLSGCQSARTRAVHVANGAWNVVPDAHRRRARASAPDTSRSLFLFFKIIK